MSTQSDLNNNPYSYFLYYCYQNDPVTVYPMDLSTVCTLYYDINSDIQINTWLVGGFGPPTMPTTLLAYPLATVLAFINNFYTIPQNIQIAQPYTIATADLNNVLPHPSMLGFLVFDSTTHGLKSWNGTSWISNSLLYVLKSGSTMSGDLNMGSNNLLAVKTLSQSQPSCISISSSTSSAIAFSAGVAKTIGTSSFSQSVNANSDFSFNSTTGECKYTGTATKLFRVSVAYSMLSLAIASTQTNYLSKNGSTTISGQRAVNTYLLLGPATTDSYSLADVVELATNDTIQLGAQSSTTTNVTYSNISYAISQI